MSGNATADILAYQLAHFNEDRGPELMAGCVISIVFAALSVMLRFYAQSLIGKGFAADSWLILAAAVVAIASTSCTIAAVNNGLGKHELRVEQDDPSPPEKTAFIFEMGYVVTILQAVALMFTKLSILLFYRRVFTTRIVFLKWMIWILFAYSLAVGIGCAVEFILACNPPQLFWLRVYLILGYEPPEPLIGVCEPQTLHLAVPLVLDLISEIALLTIPAIGLWNLQLPLKKKLGVFFAFSLGIFVTALSVVRFAFAFRLENDGDLSWDDSDSFVWTAVQICFGVASACVPAMAPLYRTIKELRTQSKASHLNKSSGNRGVSKFALLSKGKPSSADTDSVRNLASGHDQLDPERPWESQRPMQSSALGRNRGANNSIPLRDLSSK